MKKFSIILGAIILVLFVTLVIWGVYCDNTIAITNYTKYISNYTTLKKTFYRILVRSTIQKKKERVKNVALKWKPILSLQKSNIRSSNGFQ